MLKGFDCIFTMTILSDTGQHPIIDFATSFLCPWIGSILLYTVLKSLIDHNVIYLVSADISWAFPCVQSA